VMNHYIVLESSVFNLNPPSGKLLYRSFSGKPLMEELARGTEAGERIPYELLNPIQTLFLRKYRGGNALVSAPTSAGKSLIAFMFMKGREGKKVYTAPTRSLVYEKAVEMRKLFGRKVDMRTGDAIELLRSERSDVIVSTYESLALALRNGLRWAEDLSCVVIDEIHHLIGSRGWVVEELIAYLLERDVEILGLSATLPGSDELARFVDASLFIESFWRPVPLEREVRPLKNFREFTDSTDREEKIASKLLSALYELSDKDEQVIVFVHKKSVGWKMLELADRERVGIMNETVPFEKVSDGGTELAFHNADIPKEERERIERAFRRGELRMLIATHTLAYGVNLPADRVIIGVRAFYDRKEREWKIFPGQLDILQMEGRAGRLGVKEKGYSSLLPFGIEDNLLERKLRESLQGELKPFLREILGRGGEDLKKILGLFILIGFLYEGKDFRKFLRKTFSLGKHAEEDTIEEVYEWLKDRGYIEGERLESKALFCIRSGVFPVSYEEFLRRRLLGLNRLAVIRPLLFTKRFDGLYDFVKRGPTFEEDDLYIRGLLAVCGRECFSDNTHQFLFYVHGLTFKYPNVSHPPGEFSYLGTDALHLIRTLLEIRKFGEIDWSDEEILRIAHCVKYGLTEDFAPLGGIKGIGHVRANLLKRLMLEEGIKPPPLGSPTSELLKTLGEDLRRKLLDILLRDRFSQEKRRADVEATKVVKVLKGNEEGYLIDDRILRVFCMYRKGPEALRWSKKELLGIILGLW